MARDTQEIFIGDIDKHTDWGGDSSTGGLPVAGESVQAFIKDTFQKKIGYIYVDRDHNKCFGFADEEDYDTYISDPEQHDDLIIQEWYCYFPPTPVILDHAAYYGTSNEQITLVDAPSKIGSIDNGLYPNNTVYTSTVTCVSTLPYVYVALAADNDFIKAITVNNEDILDQFVRVGGDSGLFEFNDTYYKLYEFRMDSGLALDVNINIQFSK